jgi:hypothetical protein
MNITTYRPKFGTVPKGWKGVQNHMPYMRNYLPIRKKAIRLQGEK